MKRNIPKSDFTINSILGEGSFLKGEFDIKGPLRIDGHFQGKIKSSGKVYIGKSGKAESIIIAKSIVIGGILKGNIYIEDKVQILKTGKIFGNIYSASVRMEDGVIFDGECNILSKIDMKDLIQQKSIEKANLF